MSRGAFEGFEATATGPAADEYGLTDPQPFTVLREINRALQPVGMKFSATALPRAVTLTGFRMTDRAAVLLRRIADPATPLHVLCWSWDLGGDPIAVTAGWTLPLSGTERVLANQELELVPARRVVGCQMVRVILWQSDRGASAEFVTDEVRAALRHSRLANTLATLASADTTMMSAVAVREAAGELGREIAPVLRALCSDYLDLLAACYPAADGPTRIERISGFGTDLAVRA